MAMTNPVGRVNYEPNSWTGDDRGPREDPDRGFTSFPADEQGEKRRVRPETFADHYSQASLFYRSQLPVEQQHIIDAFTFELVQGRATGHPRAHGGQPPQRRRGPGVGASPTGSGSTKVPARSKAAAPPNHALDPSPALSILANPVDSFAGRKLGVLVSDGAPAAVVKALQSAAKAEGANLEVVAPRSPASCSTTGPRSPAHQMVGGGPSVLYDAVAIVVERGRRRRARGPPGRQGLRLRRPRAPQAHRPHAGCRRAPRGGRRRGGHG